MSRHTGTVLVDTNVILECYRTSSWNALANGYQVETVEDCIAETQNGFQKREKSILIDEQKLRASMGAVHETNILDRIKLDAEVPDIHLDRGEKSLWTHAKNRCDDWLFCGPDKASLRVGIRFGLREHLVSFERLLKDAGHRLKRSLRPAYTMRWHADTINQLVQIEMKKP